MSDQYDSGLDLTPDAVQPLDPDEALALEDELEEAGAFAGVTAERAAPPPLGRTPAYDFVAHQFIPRVAGGALMITGLATLRQWVEKCLRTRRGENPACDPTFGVDILPSDLLDGGVLDTERVGDALEDWERALLVHPRIDRVEDMEIYPSDDPDDDAFEITMTVYPEGLGELEGVDIDLALGGV